MLTLWITLLNNTDALLFRSDKIWTVLIVVLLIWGGILALLLRQERKIARLERKLQDRK
jgi:hypothetical protein